MATRPQPYRLKWPLSPHQVEGSDEMFEILFKGVRALETRVEALSAATVAAAPATLPQGMPWFSAVEDEADSLWTPIASNLQNFVPYVGAIQNVDLGLFTLTVPTVLGGSAVGSSLTLQATSGVGTTDFIKFLVGNNGATEAVRIVHSGRMGIGTDAPQAPLHAQSTDAQLVYLGYANANANLYPFVSVNRAKGTLALPTTVTTNDYVGGYNSNGYNGTSNIGITAILSRVVGVNGSNFLGQVQLLVNDGTVAFTGFTAVTVDSATATIFTPTTILTGSIRIGTAAPTARLHINAGTTAASTAPLKFTSGSLLTAAEAGAMEFLTDAFYGTITTGAARKTFAFLESPSFTGTVTSAGAINGPVGAAGTPTYSFTTEAGLGWYRAGAGNLAFAVGGSAPISLVSAGIALNNTAGGITFASAARIAGPAAAVTGQINFVNAAATVGIGIDVATDAILKIRTRAQSADASLTALDLTASGVLGVTGVTTFGAPAKLKNYTVATLPAGVQGYVAFVTDLLAPAFLVAATGGGAVVGPVFYDGTNWVSF